MRRAGRFIAVLLCVFMLVSCAERGQAAPETTLAPYVETFRITLPSTVPPETEPPLSFNGVYITPQLTEKHTAYQSSTAPSGASRETTPAKYYEPSTPTTPKVEILPASGVLVANASVNVREEPDADSDRVGHLDKGEEAEVTGYCSNGWVRIAFKDGEYFVNGSYLSERGDTETAVTDPPETEPTTVTKPPESTTVTTTPEPTTVTTTSEPTTPEPTTAEPSADLPVSDNLNILTGTRNYQAINYSRQKAVWFAYLDIDEMLKNADEISFRTKAAEAFDDVVSIGCNTVYVHVRSFGDAYYYSGIYPFTAAYSDVLGDTAPFDPLQIMIEEAHSRGLSFHAWINPMRTTTKERYSEMPNQYVLKQWYDSDATNGTFLVYDRSTSYYWLSPAYPAVRNLICNGVAEIVSNYNVDGIHIDDYFYPTTSSSFDKAAFEASGETDRDAWRKKVVNMLVRDIYTTVKSCNSTVLFGVSPQGNVKNNLGNLYADVETWCSTPGYLDYIVPQIYYGFNDKLPFDDTAEQWADMVTAPGVSLVCGIAAYKVGVNSEWSSGRILTDQTEYIMDIPVYDGVAYYRHGSLFGSASSSERLMRSEMAKLPKAISEF